nr:hypothetical protein [uncultured Trichococcus sp.]
MNEKEKYVGLLLQLEFAENSHRDMLILAAKYQADADRAARQARAFELRAVRLQRQLEKLEGEGINEFSITVKCIE